MESFVFAFEDFLHNNQIQASMDSVNSAAIFTSEASCGKNLRLNGDRYYKIALVETEIENTSFYFFY